jgi:hypothetical protein
MMLAIACSGRVFADTPNPVDAPKAAEISKPAETPKPAEKPKTGETPKPAEEAKPAAPPAEPVDLDFALQGEFRGSITVSKSKSQVVGLQIRPTGNGRFEAAQYLGGLPGERPRVAAPTLLIGKRNEQFVTLSGGPWAILAHPDHCWLVDREGNRVGSLERVERKSPTLGAQPPKNAVVLFDGTGTDQFAVGQMTEDGLLMEGADVSPLFQDFDLHLEFKLPYMPTASGQGRSNSGIYLQSRYEVQILDSFGLDPANNDCGALYTYRKPDVNMCLPPLVWQTYDVIFTSPRWASDGKKLQNARVTAWLNGVKVQDNVELPSKTGAGQPEDPTMLPIRLQNHKNPVRFRNVWIIDRGLLPAAGFPPLPKGKKGN